MLASDVPVGLGVTGSESSLCGVVWVIPSDCDWCVAVCTKCTVLLSGVVFGEASVSGGDVSRSRERSSLGVFPGAAPSDLFHVSDVGEALRSAGSSVSLG